MTIAFRLTAIAYVAMCASAGAQRPDFSGEWVRVDSAVTRSVASVGDGAFRRGDMGSGWGATVAIAQRPDSFVVEYDFFSAYDLQPRVRMAYANDGSESKNGITIGHAESVQKSRLAWQGSTLVVTTQYPAPKGLDARTTSEVRQSLSLDAAGALVVETVRGGNTVRTTYKRK